MEEIAYCVEIINLFENENNSNSFILQEIKNRGYKEKVVHLDKIKLEERIEYDYETYKSGYEGYFDSSVYQKMYVTYTELLKKQIQEGKEDYRYGYSFLDYTHRIKHLFHNEKLDEKQMLEVILKINRDVGRKHLFIYLLEYMKEEKKWDEMELYIEQMPIYKASVFQKKDKPTSMYGYRIRIYEFIEKVDLKKFKLYFKKCLPVYDKYEMKEIKTQFILNYSIQKGVKEAIELTKKVPFKNFEIDALLPQATILSYNEMQLLIKEYKDVIEEQKSDIKEQLLVHTLKSRFEEGDYNEDYFLEVFEMLEKLDRKERFGDFKLKDWLFCELGESTKNYDLIVKCRKKAKHPILKEELKYWELENKNNLK